MKNQGFLNKCKIFEKKFEKSVDIFCRKSIILSCSPEKTTNTTTEKESLKNGFEKRFEKNKKKLLTNKKSCDKILNVDGESRKRKKTLNLEN